MNKLAGGTVYQLTIHLILVTKYRRKVIHLGMLQRLQEIFAATCRKWDCQLVEFSGEADHVHLLVEINPKVQISAFANNLKTVSSRLIRQEFAEQVNQFYSKPVFWKIGYCVVSTGGTSIDVIKQYIHAQDEPDT